MLLHWSVGNTFQWSLKLVYCSFLFKNFSKDNYLKNEKQNFNLLREKTYQNILFITLPHKLSKSSPVTPVIAETSKRAFSKSSPTCETSVKRLRNLCAPLLADCQSMERTCRRQSPNSLTFLLVFSNFSDTFTILYSRRWNKTEST